MNTFISRKCTTLLGFAAAASLVACGKTDVTFELTDAPPDTASIAHVYVTLSKVEAHVAGTDDKDEGSEAAPASKGDDTETEAEGGAGGEDHAGWRTVAAPAGTFDLVALQNDVRKSLGALQLPDGKITQIRLFIDMAGKNQVELTSGATCALDLTQVPPTGVKINHPFKALDVEGSHMNIVVDFDLNESLDQTGSCGFALKPVIKLKHVEKD